MLGMSAAGIPAVDNEGPPELELKWARQLVVKTSGLLTSSIVQPSAHVNPLVRHQLQSLPAYLAAGMRSPRAVEGCVMTLWVVEG